MAKERKLPENRMDGYAWMDGIFRVLVRHTLSFHFGGLSARRCHGLGYHFWDMVSYLNWSGMNVQGRYTSTFIWNLLYASRTRRALRLCRALIR